ncbi:MAG: hypothetical protein K0R57_4695 [Paenibacillaceae bacterium]|jgi:hypothetical protein|nr:hypothetical protein [Paenibacillaceae bacterium]
MKQFSNVMKEYAIWVHSYRLVQVLLPFYLYILFGGLGSLLLYDVLLQLRKYVSILFTVGHYAFFLGIFLTLAAPNKKYLPYALWGYAFFILFPFRTFSLYQVIEAALYIVIGYWFMKYEATQEN